jgi:hypothetical protein|tara:strand:- start:924 stop:1070 length:147 start_codon:yes stop_codon:yes gene_type:complete
MIENILQMLEIAKQQKEIGELTHIALGKNKYPDSIKEAYKQFKIELCQ